MQSHKGILLFFLAWDLKEKLFFSKLFHDESRCQLSLKFSQFVLRHSRQNLYPVTEVM